LQPKNLASPVGHQPTFQAPISKKLSNDFWQSKKCNFLELQSSDLFQSLIFIAKKEIHPNSVVSLFEDFIEIEADGVLFKFDRPKDRDKPWPDPNFLSENPFLNRYRQPIDEHTEKPTPVRLPIQTKRTCEVLAQARAYGWVKQANALQSEAIRCLDWEWSGGSIVFNEQGVKIWRPSIEFNWSWEDLLLAAET